MLEPSTRPHRRRLRELRGGSTIRSRRAPPLRAGIRRGHRFGWAVAFQAARSKTSSGILRSDPHSISLVLERGRQHEEIQRFPGDYYGVLGRRNRLDASFLRLREEREGRSFGAWRVRERNKLAACRRHVATCDSKTVSTDS